MHLQTFEPGHIISYRTACASSQCSDQLAYPRSLTSVFARHSVGKCNEVSKRSNPSRKHAYIILTPFYIVKLGFTGVHIIFLISALNQRLWYSLEPPRRGGSNEYWQCMFWAQIWKMSEFLSDLFIFQFLVVKFSVYLNRRVFVLPSPPAPVVFPADHSKAVPLLQFFFLPSHYENMPIQTYWRFYHQTMKSSDEKILIFFIFLLKNIDCGYSLEPPRRGGSNEYPRYMFWADIRKIKYTHVNPSFSIYF